MVNDGLSSQIIHFPFENIYISARNCIDVTIVIKTSDFLCASIIQHVFDILCVFFVLDHSYDKPKSFFIQIFVINRFKLCSNASMHAKNTLGRSMWMTHTFSYIFTLKNCFNYKKISDIVIIIQWMLKKPREQTTWVYNDLNKSKYNPYLITIC